MLSTSLDNYSVQLAAHRLRKNWVQNEMYFLCCFSFDNT
jgi:hypothetical protein